MKENLNWAVLGTGVIANEMAQALQKMGKRLYAVGNRTHEKAVAFGKKYQVEKVYDNIEDMFFDEKAEGNVKGSGMTFIYASAPFIYVNNPFSNGKLTEIVLVG